ncbi:MAG: class I SAM-dependent methyltransferase family protein, partial [Thaumarchaeota archaeon]|nr:class I SAM-dependent methyltransferase family protein [Nitrososphaerota archaeon]
MPLLKSVLRGRLSDREINLLSSSFDIIGDIVIIKIPDELASKQALIGEEILSHAKNVKTVLKQDSDVSGEFRIRSVSLIAGEEKYETIYKESGISIKVDVRQVYFSPRLSTERLRLRSLAVDGEKVLNMFAGVGTFSFVIAKTKNCVIDSIDKNPEAIRLAVDSLKLNKHLAGKVNPVLSDATDYSENHKGEFDRILMPLPERSKDFLKAAVLACKVNSEAVIHYYVHVPEDKFRENGWIEKHLESIG